MRAVVVYESMYGNTRMIAEAIGSGLRSFDSGAVVPVGKVTPELLADVDLLVAGGPTHAWHMSRPGSRQSAVEAARKPDSGLTLEPAAAGPGLREWFASLASLSCNAVAFDTRMKIPAALSGRASKGIARQLRLHGCVPAAKSESFFVSKGNQLLPGEEERARAWGAQLASVALNARLGSG
jgi:hypothetical protein